MVTFLFERLLTSYLQAEWDGRRYDGRIAPRSIGRRKDFWNRLIQAYRDLLIRDVLQGYKRQERDRLPGLHRPVLRGFRGRDGDLISSDPHRFPGIARFHRGRHAEGHGRRAAWSPASVVSRTARAVLRAGAVISNTAFKAGAFDMASAEKFCKLLVACAEERLPVVCFISSGGMQTMEGAGALFSMAAINDRLTRFVRDFDLPVIVFGFGDCTGGAQASFVTHPLVQTYYFSGASMPFAGQIVVCELPALGLPSRPTISVQRTGDPCRAS